MVAFGEGRKVFFNAGFVLVFEPFDSICELHAGRFDETGLVAV